MGGKGSKGQSKTSPEDKLLQKKYKRYWPEYANTWFDMRGSDDIFPGHNSYHAKCEEKFLRAAWSKQASHLTRMIRGHFVSEIDAVDSVGRTALHFCALSGSDTCVSALLLQKTYDKLDPNIRDSLERTALHYAVFRGRANVVQRLLLLEADVNAKDVHGLTSLMIACSTPYLYFADLLAPSDLAARGAYRRKTPVTHTERIDVSYPHSAFLERFEVVVLRTLLDTPAESSAVDVNMGDYIGMTALMYAAKYGHLLAASVLIEAEADLESRDKGGMSAFLHAVQHEHNDVVKYLISCSADVNACNKIFLTALHLAIQNDDMRSWSALIDAGADIHAIDSMGQSPILMALKMKNSMLFEILMDTGAKLNTINVRGWNIVIQAINSNMGGSLSRVFNRMTDREGRKQVVRWADPQGWTALHHAVNLRSRENVTMLLDIDSETLAMMGDCNGTTPLHMAAENDAVEILALLCNNVKDLSVVNYSMETPLHLAAHSGSLSCMMELLNIKRHLCCSDSTVVDSTGRTLLMRACIGGNIDCVRLMLQNKHGNLNFGFTDPLINAQDNNGQSALMHACLNGHWEMLTFLVIAKANLECVDNDGFTALHCAAGEGEVYSVQALLDLGCSQHILDKRGNTALHCAAEMREPKVCLTLLEFDANISARNYCDETALTIAINIRATGVCEVLCAKMREIDPTLGMRKGARIKAHGKFMVTIKDCTHLAVRNFETINAYVALQFQSSEERLSAALTSAECSKNSCPSWHETFEFDTEFLATSACLCITVFRLPDNENWLPLDDRTKLNEVGIHSRTSFGSQFSANQANAKKAQEIELLDLKKEKEKSHITDSTDMTWDVFNLAQSRLGLPPPPVPRSHLPYGFALIKFRHLRSIVYDANPHQFDAPLRGCTLGGRIQYEVDFCPRLWECTHNDDERRLIERRVSTPRDEDAH